VFGLFCLLQDAFLGGLEIEPRGTAGAVEPIFRDFVLPFEAISFLLLAALIGAIVLSRKDDAP
jgi:NADH:ubiquinone oxidoreductase subunit 6 (subunit J)